MFLDYLLSENFRIIRFSFPNIETIQSVYVNKNEDTGYFDVSSRVINFNWTQVLGIIRSKVLSTH